MQIVVLWFIPYKDNSVGVYNFYVQYYIKYICITVFVQNCSP